MCPFLSYIVVDKFMVTFMHARLVQLFDYVVS